MAREGDAQLLEAMRLGMERGQMSMHLSYRKARRVEGFRQALAAQVGERAVLIRDWFLPVSLVLLAAWFALAEWLGLHEISYRVAGSQMSLGFITFALLLLALVLFSRKHIRPLQGPALHRVALSDPELFVRLWQRGAVALITRQDRDRICQSPKDDWRQYVRRTLVF